MFDFHECTVVNVIDMTTVKKLTQMEYQAWRQQIRESSVSHELITPLRCLVKLSQDLTDGNSRENNNVCNLIFSQAKLISAQINDILDTNLSNKRTVVPNLS